MSELVRLMQTARLGFSIVPIGMVLDGKGMGLMHMDGDGMRFQPNDGSEPIVITWEEFDKK